MCDIFICETSAETPVPASRHRAASYSNNIKTDSDEQMIPHHFDCFQFVDAT
jgi:hypothetical protein